MPNENSSYEAHYQKLFSEGKTQWSTDQAGEALYIAATMFIRPQERVLLLGCGVGMLAERLVPLGLECIGVDISPTALSKARERLAAYPNYQFFETSVLDLPDSLGLFDLIMDEYCTHCIPTERLALWQSLQRRLKPNGRVIIKAMVGETPRILARNPRKSFDAATGTVFRDGIPERHVPTYATLRAELEQSGFEVLSAEHLINSEPDEDEGLFELRVA